MLDRSKIGSYYPAYSSIYKMSSTIKLFCFIFYMVLICITNNLNIHIFLCFYVLFLIFISKVPLRYFLNIFYSLRYILIIMLLIFYINFFTLDIVIVYFIKLIITVLFISLIIYTTTSNELSYGFEKLFNVINIFRIRISGIVNFFVNLLKFYPLLCKNQNKVLLSASSRGIDYKHRGIHGRIKALIYSYRKGFYLTIRELKDKKEYLKTRGFSLKKTRTIVRKGSFTLLSFVSVLYFLLLVAYYLYERGIYEIFM